MHVDLFPVLNCFSADSYLFWPLAE